MKITERPLRKASAQSYLEANGKPTLFSVTDFTVDEEKLRTIHLDKVTKAFKLAYTDHP